MANVFVFKESSFTDWHIKLWPLSIWNPTMQERLYSAVKENTVKLLCLVARSCPTLSGPKDCSPPGFSVHGDSPCKNSGVGSHALLQEIFPTWGSIWGLQHCRQILYLLSHQGNPGILEWVAYPFSRGSSWPRNQTRVSCIAGGFFTSWATREAPSTTGGFCALLINKALCALLIE